MVSRIIPRNRVERKPLRATGASLVPAWVYAADQPSQMLSAVYHIYSRGVIVDQPPPPHVISRVPNISKGVIKR
jgi:hypothetical protein